MHRSRATLNFLTLLTSRLVSQIVSLGVGLLLVRWLTDDLFAAYSLATTSIGLAGIVVDFGLDAILIRDSAANSSRASSLFYNAIWIRMVIGGGVAAALVLVAGDLTGRRDLLLIGGLALLPRAVLRSTAAILTGQGRVRAAAILEAVGTLAVSLLTVALALILPLSGIDGAAAAIIALLVGNVVGMAAALRVRPTQTQDSDSPSNRLRERGLGGEGIPNQLTDLLRAGLPFLLVALAGAAFQSLDLYIVQRSHTIPTRRLIRWRCMLPRFAC
ncbi:MAG: oligosaccharide flippase family protein [Anaerolineae bacterium]